MINATAPMVAIVGQTASGKTALALDLAERFDGEIICADSRTIYRGMDTGTAKPTAEERAKVPHHCIDLIDPTETFSAADFKSCALEAIRDIGQRDKLPIMVGGTGLYIDAVLFDYQFGEPADRGIRTELATKTVEELQAMIRERGYEMPENKQNKRYLIRTIERHGNSGDRSALRSNTIVIGLSVDGGVLERRDTQRIDTMIESGFIEECRVLLARFPDDSPGFLAPGYKAFIPYVRGECTFEEARDVFIRGDMQLAKRQRTWFQRNPSIHWVSDRSEAVDIVTTFLNK